MEGLWRAPAVRPKVGGPEPHPRHLTATIGAPTDSSGG
jgi:hypothetical protein